MDTEIRFFALKSTKEKVLDRGQNRFQCEEFSNKQPIMRTEDRLFDRGWVRSAMATRKCGNIYFPKYFMAVRLFFTRNFFQELFGLEGSKISLKILSGAQSEDLEPSLTIQEFFSKIYSWFYMQRMCTLFG